MNNTHIRTRHIAEVERKLCDIICLHFHNVTTWNQWSDARTSTRGRGFDFYCRRFRFCCSRLVLFVAVVVYFLLSLAVCLFACMHVCLFVRLFLSSLTYDGMG